VIELFVTFFLGVLIEGVSYFRYTYQAKAQKEAIEKAQG
jgi:hypothetical protein